MIPSREKFVYLVRTGAQPAELAKKYEMSADRVMRMAAAFGVKFRLPEDVSRNGQVWSEHDKKRVQEMREAGRTHDEIGKVFGVSGNRIGQLAQKWRLPMVRVARERKPIPKAKSIHKPEFEPRKPIEPVTRKCLMCADPFKSTHRLEFVCQHCKGTETWRAGA